MQNSLADSLLIDNYQRRYQYLRLSLTELCNFRCQYCLPEGYAANSHHKFLSLKEIDHLVKTFSDLGVRKIRLTGGEPTLRRDFTDILSLISQNKSIVEIALTTNGSRLLKHIPEWKKAGLTSLNVSIDSFVPHIFQMITGENKLQHIIDGIDKSLSVGMNKVKVNTVLMKGINDNLTPFLNWIKYYPIELRFIELMETGEGSEHFRKYHCSGSAMEQQLIEQGWQLLPSKPLAGPAKVYHHDDFMGKIGLIMPYSKNFCNNCNRLRVSSMGKLHYCLFGDSAVDLRDLLQHESQSNLLKQRILTTLKIKPPTHYLHQHQTGINNNLASIGG